MARHDATVAGHLLEQSLQAAQQMLATCSAAGGEQDRSHGTSPLAPAGNSRLNNSTRKCRSVQFGLTPRDFHRLCRISEQLQWSRAELARRCLQLVMEFLEERYPELRSGKPVAVSESSLNVEQLSLWPALNDPSATRA